MQRRFAMLATAAGLVLATLTFAPSAALAANAPAGCEKIRGTIVCTETKKVGNAPDHSHAKSTTTNTSKKGSTQSSHEEQKNCTGPRGQCK